MDRFNQIFNKVFVSSKKAILYCQSLARLCGFSVRVRTSKTTTIYIVCSREGLPELSRELNRKRGRNSERCNCDWRIVLYRRSSDQWEFRSGKIGEHNHPIFSSEAYLDADLKPAQSFSLPSIKSVSPLPSLRSLDLPLPRLSGSSSPTTEYSPAPSSRGLYRLPPLAKTTSYHCPLSLSFLLN
ncbi:hypothetical protein DSO57_1029498 [Entomophthora muscae]|uniref:Uncharacterized protein n=1 Tax=Entomophthora muscae TaxID=34485 RepID=A0ACC2ULT5_9FUNG|nr:hypothetical protein DSO57_1029498 [Entomophthora muscae]